MLVHAFVSRRSLQSAPCHFHRLLIINSPLLVCCHCHVTATGYNPAGQLRCIYFDRIEREEVEAVIASIFRSVASLEDMQFLVKYAAQVRRPSLPSYSHLRLLLIAVHLAVPVFM